MSIEVRYFVISPEAGVQKSSGFPPPMGGSRPGMVVSPPMGGPRQVIGGPPPGMTPHVTSSHTTAKRLSTLENKTVYLVDTGYGGSYRFMQALQKWFADHMPSVKIIRKRKTGQVFMDDTTDLWEEVKAKGHAVVLGVAG